MAQASTRPHDTRNSATDKNDMNGPATTSSKAVKGGDLQDSKSSPDSGIAVVRTTVNLHPDAVAALREIANDRATTVAEIIRRAIWMEKYVHDTQKNGGKILIQDADQTLKELLIR